MIDELLTDNLHTTDETIQRWSPAQISTIRLLQDEHTDVRIIGQKRHSHAMVCEFHTYHPFDFAPLMGMICPNGMTFFPDA